MRKFILTVRPEPDGALDVATLARRNVPALSAPLMAPSFHTPEIPASGKFSGVILTSRHAVIGLCAATGGKLDDRIAGLPLPSAVPPGAPRARPGSGMSPPAMAAVPGLCR